MTASGGACRGAADRPFIILVFPDRVDIDVI
jgi:hypothetical protein